VLGDPARRPPAYADHGAVGRPPAWRAGERPVAAGMDPRPAQVVAGGRGLDRAGQVQRDRVDERNSSAIAPSPVQKPSSSTRRIPVYASGVLAVTRHRYLGSSCQCRRPSTGLPTCAHNRIIRVTKKALSAKLPPARNRRSGRAPPGSSITLCDRALVRGQSTSNRRSARHRSDADQVAQLSRTGYSARP
jgi:hypothetical protein